MINASDWTANFNKLLIYVLRYDILIDMAALPSQLMCYIWILPEIARYFGWYNILVWPTYQHWPKLWFYQP